MLFFGRAATGVRDENLEARRWGWRKGQGGTEATTRSILDLSANAIKSPPVLSRCAGDYRLGHD